MMDSLNDECPIPLGAIGHMEYAQYNGNTVTFHYSLTGVFDINNFTSNQEQLHQYILNNYRNNSDESFRQLLQAIVKAEADLDLIFEVEEGDTFTIHFTCDELSDNMPSFVGDPETYLQSTIESHRIQLPITYAEGMIIKEIDLNDEFLTYYIECDEDLYNINEIQQSALEYHEDLKTMIINSSDPSFVRTIEMLKVTNRGLRYIYIGTLSAKEAVIAITSEEL